MDALNEIWKVLNANRLKTSFHTAINAHISDVKLYTVLGHFIVELSKAFIHVYVTVTWTLPPAAQYSFRSHPPRISRIILFDCSFCLCTRWAIKHQAEKCLTGKHCKLCNNTKICFIKTINIYVSCVYNISFDISLCRSHPRVLPLAPDRLLVSPPPCINNHKLLLI